VSLARTPGATIVALTDAGPVGVDVTTARDGPVSGARRLRRVPAQFDPGATNRTITGVRTESLLKALGTGLTIDPGLIELSAPTEPAVITDWQVPDLPVPQAKIYDLITTDHHHAAVTVLTPVPPPLVVRHVTRLEPAVHTFTAT
jgi:4'-phosphopantetheinyl transferase